MGSGRSITLFLVHHSIFSVLCNKRLCFGFWNLQPSLVEDHREKNKRGRSAVEGDGEMANLLNPPIELIACDFLPDNLLDPTFNDLFPYLGPVIDHVLPPPSFHGELST